MDPGGTEKHVTVAMRTYDGKGGFKSIGNSHGQVTGVTRNIQITGVYDVNADCTGIATVNIPGQREPLVSLYYS